MKKVIAMLAFIALTTVGVSAQENQGPRGPRMTKEEMVQRRTEFMAQQYGLNDTQKQQLLELNQKYSDNIPMMRPRPGGRPQGGMNGQMRPQNPPTDNANGQMHQGRRPGDGQGRPQFDPEKMKEYEDGLSKIMTSEQFAKYEADRKARMERRGRGGDNN